MSNKHTYESANVVKTYVALNELQKPEQTILDNFKNKLGGMKMLDIGVGGGRTTCHFANLVKEYVGIDYSVNMVSACRNRFSNLFGKVSFELCDVRSMKMFEDYCFDFILCSFNGLDYISPTDRLDALREIRRVGKSGGFFCFSTHNLQSIDNLLTIKSSVNLVKALYAVLQHFLLRVVNKNFKKLKSEEYAIIRDGAFHFRLTTYYIKPKTACKQLTDVGYKNIRVFSLATGNEITNTSELDTITDPWLYYLCTI